MCLSSVEKRIDTADRENIPACLFMSGSALQSFPSIVIVKIQVSNGDDCISIFQI